MNRISPFAVIKAGDKLLLDIQIFFPNRSAKVGGLEQSKKVSRELL